MTSSKEERLRKVARIVDPFEWELHDFGASREPPAPLGSTAGSLLKASEIDAEYAEEIGRLRVALIGSKAALDELIMTYMDGDNEGGHGGDHDDAECPTCQVIVRAQEAFRQAALALSTVVGGDSSSNASPSPLEASLRSSETNSQPSAQGEDK